MEILQGGFSFSIPAVASAFLTLQSARHKADYGLSAVFAQAVAEVLILHRSGASVDWNLARNSEEGNVFLAALAFGKRWSK